MPAALPSREGDLLASRPRARAAASGSRAGRALPLPPSPPPAPARAAPPVGEGAARPRGPGGGRRRRREPPGLMSKSMPFLGASLGSSPSSLAADRLPRVGFLSPRKVSVRPKAKPQPRGARRGRGGPAVRTHRSGGGTAGLAAAPVGAPVPPRPPPAGRPAPLLIPLLSAPGAAPRSLPRPPRPPQLGPRARPVPVRPPGSQLGPRFDGNWEGENPRFRRYGRPGRSDLIIL